MVKRILIVDDEETITFSLYQSFILSKKPYEVITAETGEEALEKFQEKPFHLVITDIFLPGISGFDVLKKIRGSAPDTKFIVITAYGSGDKKEQAMREGASLYIEKPFDIRDFKKKVMEILE
ncbi:MAG: response regulator [Calditrichaeota bacterium]|nr:response regulator [Calditrichota bacterium]